MNPPKETEAARRVRDVLESWDDNCQVLAEKEDLPEGKELYRHIDFVVFLRSKRFIGEYRKSGNIASIASAVESLKNITETEAAYPLLVVPYMGQKGARLCKQHEVAWVDLSGNALIDTESLFIHVEGKPNQYKRKGRPTNLFAPKSSRIARWLLAHPNERVSQKEISERVRVGPGWVSKVTSRLEEKGFIAKDDNGRIQVERPSLLLEAWHEKYDFSKHTIEKGTIASRNSVELTKDLASAFESMNLAYATTGLAAAWMLTQFARFRIATFFLDRAPSDRVKREIGLREDPKGANVWLVTPNDEGVFHENVTIENVRCVHPIQVYLDLKGHPERSDEAGASLRENCLDW